MVCRFGLVFPDKAGSGRAELFGGFGKNLFIRFLRRFFQYAPTWQKRSPAGRKRVVRPALRDILILQRNPPGRKKWFQLDLWRFLWRNPLIYLTQLRRQPKKRKNSD